MNWDMFCSRLLCFSGYHDAFKVPDCADDSEAYAWNDYSYRQ